MSKPAAGSAPLRWGTAPLIPADLTEPDTTHKDEGWQDVEEPPHSYFNYWMNLVYLWLVYLDNLTGEALTWTALETFSAGVAITGGLTADTATIAALIISGNVTIGGTLGVTGASTLSSAKLGGADGTHGVLDAAGTVSLPAIYGQAGSGAFGVGVRGVGTARSGGGNSGGSFTGGAGTTTGNGGAGGLGSGGDAGTTTGSGGTGFSGFGGNVNGAGNAAGAGGIGGVFTGGAISADANNRFGGDAVRLTAGLGQAGYGNAVRALHGNVVLDDGQIVANGNATPHQLGATIIEADLNVIGGAYVDGPVHANADVSVTGATDLTGLLSANGGIATGVFHVMTLINSWIPGAVTIAQYNVDPTGVKRLRGSIAGGLNGTVAVNLPVGFRPLFATNISVGTTNTTLQAQLQIATNGDVTVVMQGGTVGGESIYLDGVTFV